MIETAPRQCRGGSTEAVRVDADRRLTSRPSPYLPCPTSATAYRPRDDTHGQRSHRRHRPGQHGHRPRLLHGRARRRHARRRLRRQPRRRRPRRPDVPERRRSSRRTKTCSPPAPATPSSSPRPHYQHPVITDAAFAKGLHVLCEKPVAVRVSDARKINELHKQHPHLKFGLMFQMRTVPLYLRRSATHRRRRARRNHPHHLDRHRLVPHLDLLRLRAAGAAPGPARAAAC